MKEFVTPSATLAHMTQLIMPQHANSLAITFGGQVLLTGPPLSAIAPWWLQTNCLDRIAFIYFAAKVVTCTMLVLSQCRRAVCPL